MKKNFKIISLLFLASIMIVSCVVKQEIYFKKDFSGSYKYTFDFTEYSNAMSGEEGSDSTKLKNEDFQEYLESIREALIAIKGLNNIKIINDADNGKIYYSFDFDGIESLNQALVYSGAMYNENLAQNPPYFTRKKKNLTFNRPANPMPKESEDGEDTSYMNDFFKWEFSITFESELKKYDIMNDTAVKITNANHTFTEFGNIYDISDKNVKWQFKTK